VSRLRAWRPFGESWRAWIALGVGVLAVSAHSASSVNISVLMKSILGEFGWSRSAFALTMTFRLIAMTLVMPLAGRLSDRLGARTVLGAGAFVVGSCLFGVAAIRSWGDLAALSVVMGPGQAAIGSVAASALVLRLFERHRGIAIGILNGGDNVLNSRIPMAATAILATHGWRAAVFAMGCAYLVLTALILLVLRPSDGRSTEPDADDTTAPVPWHDRRLWVVVTVYALTYAWITSIQIHFHAYQTDVGRSHELASSILGLYLLVGAVGSPLFGWLSQRTSACFTLLVVVIGLTLSAATISQIEDTATLRVWAVGHGLVNSGVVAVLALVLHELFGGRHIGRLMGVAMVFCMTATLLGNQWAAWVFDRTGGYEPAWRLYAVMMAITIPAVWWLWRVRRDPPLLTATRTPA